MFQNNVLNISPFRRWLLNKLIIFFLIMIHFFEMLSLSLLSVYGNYIISTPVSIISFEIGLDLLKSDVLNGLGSIL